MAFLTILVALLPGKAIAQNGGSEGIRLPLRSTERAIATREAALTKLEQEIRAQFPPGLPISEERVRSRVREAYKATLTLNEWYTGLTAASQRLVREFLGKLRPADFRNFRIFLRDNGHLTIKEIGDRFPTQSLSVPSTEGDDSHPWIRQIPRSGAVGLSSLPMPPAGPSGQTSGQSTSVTPKPYDGIGGSKLVAKRVYQDESGFYDDAYRYHLTTPEQSIFLRGVPANTESGGAGCGYACDEPVDVTTQYPCYHNDWCCDCCGPAAGQSILAWYNVPVRWSNGTVATTTTDIQHRLANLMETTDGANFTYPDDLADVLYRDEFIGDKGFCYEDGGGTREQLHFMLSTGAPVILLWATGDYAHYVTVYGYDVRNDLYHFANAKPLHWSTLAHRWSFDAADDHLAFLLSIGGVHPYSLVSYSGYGCSTPWNCSFSLGLDSSTATTLPEVYYETFSSNYITPASDPLFLNFYAYLRQPFLAPLPTADVSSGDQTFALWSGNAHIIVSAMPPGGIYSNFSADEVGVIKVELDRHFVESYPEMYCGFRVLGVNGQVLFDGDYGPCQQNADAIHGTTYEYQYGGPFDPNQRLVEFIVHGGLRSERWYFDGCLHDNDLDGICDDTDTDDDNDSFLDVADNCPLIANPDQWDTDENGVGFACDSCEQCMSRFWKQVTEVDPLHPVEMHPQMPADVERPRSQEVMLTDFTDSLYLEGMGCTCSGPCDWILCQSDEELSPLDDDYLKVIDLVHSKWWNQLIAPPSGEPPLPGVTRDIGALLHFDTRGVDVDAAQRALSSVLYGTSGSITLGVP